MRMLSVAVVLACVVGLATAQDKSKDKDKKAATIKVLLPESSFKETIVKIEGVEMKTTGTTRTYTSPTLETGKEYAYKIEALIEPNNYTKITRTKEVTFKAGDE